MNIDELLTDNVPPSSSQSAPGGGAEGSKAGASVNMKKLNGEIEMTKARLSDQKFKITDYPDPLLPRKGANSNLSGGRVTSKHEERLKRIIADIKESSGVRIGTHSRV